MFYFLWGVFRGKKENSSNSLKNALCPSYHASSRMQSSMKEENAKEDEAYGAIEKEKAFSVSYGDSGAVEETEEGEIDVSPHLKDGKTSGARTVTSSSYMNQKVDLDVLNNEGLCERPVIKNLNTGAGGKPECSISRRETSGNESTSRESGAVPSEEEKIIKKKPAAIERIVFPLDLNDGKVDDDEMVENNPRALGMVPHLELALGEEKTTSTMTIEEHRSSCSHKAEDRMGNQEDNAASLSLSLSFSALEKEQQQQQNESLVSGLENKKQDVNTPLYLFRGFPDKSSS